MDLKKGVLTLSSSLDNEHIHELLPRINKKLTKIEEVVVDDKNVASSALFSLLSAIKREKESVKIDLLENGSNLSSLGDVTFIDERV